MSKIAKRPSKIRKATPLASRVLQDYEYWLNRKYGTTATYLTNAKTFLRTIKQGGSVISQLDSYSDGKGFSLRSVLKRFRLFIEESSIDFVVNDLNEKKVPLGNIYVKLFLISNADRLTGEKSKSTYATILNQYFQFIDNNLEGFNKRTAEKFINYPTLSSHSRRLYKSVLKAFCDWAIKYHYSSASELSKEERQVQKGLKMISLFSLKEIASIKVKSSKVELNKYHKDSLTIIQRNRLFRIAESSRDRAILSLMGINGLRSIEITRLQVLDCKFKEKKLWVWGKGKTSKSKDDIKFLRFCRESVSRYLKEYDIYSGALFPKMTVQKVASLARYYFVKMNLVNGKYTAHSLRHTAGQIMYDKGIPLEYIQKTLRHADLRTTLIYAQKAIDRKYFKTMPDVV